MHRFKYPFKKRIPSGACRYEAYTTDYHSSNTVLWSKEMFFKRSFKKHKDKSYFLSKKYCDSFFSHLRIKMYQSEDTHI